MSKCSDCKFFIERGRESESDEDCGWCHRFPPRVLKNGLEFTSTFPTVRPDWWCGEFKDRDDGKNSVELAR